MRPRKIPFLATGGNTILKFFLLIIAHFVFVQIDSFGQEIQWAKSYRSGLDLGTNITSVAIGPNDHVFIGGTFDTKMTIDDKLLTSRRNGAGFIAKLDSSGNALWANVLGSAIYGSINGISTDQSGNVYAVGSFTDSLFIKGDTIISEKLFNSVLIKFSVEGDILWYQHFSDFLAGKIKVDSRGNIYIMGLDYSEPNLTLATRIVKLDQVGTEIFNAFLNRPSNTGIFLGVNIAIDIDDNVYISGLTFGEILLGDVLYSENSSDAFALVKYSQEGVPEWIQVVDVGQAGGSWYTSTIAVDGAGSIYYYTFNDSMSLTKYDADGNKIWARKNLGINIGIQDMAIDDRGHLLTTGTFSGNFNLDKATFKSSGRSAFVAEFDDKGECQWSLTETNGQNDYGRSIVRSQYTGALYVSGMLQSNNPAFDGFTFPGSMYDVRSFLLKIKSSSAPLVLDLGEDRSICEGGSVAISASGFVTYEWNTGSKDSSINITEPGLYTLRAYDYAGNPHIDSLRVLQCLASLIPNVITPNGDHYNDYFEIEQLDLTKRNTLIIFDRWGRKVYANYSYQNNWNGSTVVAGTYYYELISGSDGKSYKGWVQILK